MPSNSTQQPTHRAITQPIAPLLLMAFGVYWFLSWAEVFGRPTEQASLVFRDPWWVTVLISGTLCLVGALRIRLTFRMRQQRV